jgi:putative DNA primase/helicase
MGGEVIGGGADWLPEPAPETRSGNNGDGAGPTLLPFLHNDHGNSQRFVAMSGNETRYCPPMKKWFRWDGRRWAIDDAEKSRSLVKATLLEFLRQSIAADNKAAEKFALGSLNSKGVSNALREAQDQLIVMPAELDAHPYLLTFENGVVDLRSGRLLGHDPALMLTKLIHHSYDPSIECPRFQRFLDRVFGIVPDAAEAAVARAQELVSFLQKALGYSLTAVTSEKVVFVLYGPRDNGKTTLLATIYNLLDECAALLQIDTLMVKPGGENSNTQADLADLRGARFVMTSETEQGARLAEAKLKRITQGLGRIKATRKYENPIEFDETHKLWIDANYLPVVRSGDEAIWRRLRPIPFSVVIPREEQDRELSSKLVAEAQGILAWMVAGAARWYREGLGTVSPVEETSSDWRQDMNQVGRFIDDCCVKDDPSRSFTSDGALRARDLYEAYKRWSHGNGERYMSQRSFTQQVVGMGFIREHRNDGNYYKGIELRDAGLALS